MLRILKFFTVPILLIVITVSQGIFVLKPAIKENLIDVNGVVIEKFITSRPTKFIMIVNPSTGNPFDINVTPATFATHNKGDHISFNQIHKFEIGQPDEYYGFCLLTFAVLSAISMFSFFYKLLNLLYDVE